MKEEDDMKNLKSLEQNQNHLRAMNKKLDEEKNRYENIYLPKIKETMKYQKELYDEIERIRTDANLLP